jgi:hypothetical protein
VNCIINKVRGINRVFYDITTKLPRTIEWIENQREKRRLLEARSFGEFGEKWLTAEATVQRARPVALTATAAVLAFIPLTYSAFWGPMAYTLIGGTAVGTILTLVFLPAAYAIWFKIKPAKGNSKQ